MADSTLIQTHALLLKKVVHRESDALLTLFTQRHGKLTVNARGAQRSTKRFGGALEPMHCLLVEVAKGRGEHFDLRSARVEVPRLALTGSLERMEAAGRVLGWLRKSAVERTPEPQVWQLVDNLLDRLDSREALDVSVPLASTGLALLAAWGWGLELESCVRCGRECPQGKAAFVDAARGGLVCVACGGARTRIDAAQRQRLVAAAQGDADALSSDDAALTLQLTETALRAHADIG